MTNSDNRMESSSPQTANFGTAKSKFDMSWEDEGPKVSKTHFFKVKPGQIEAKHRKPLLQIQKFHHQEDPTFLNQSTMNTTYGDSKLKVRDQIVTDHQPTSFMKA